MTSRPALYSALLGLLLLLIATSAHAQEDRPIAPDRPGFGDAAATLGEMNLQIETGYAYTDLEGRTLHEVGQLLLRFGLSERVELRGHLNSYVFDPDSFDVAGMDDAAVSVKINLLDALRGTGPTLTAIAALTVPTGHDRFSDGEWQPEGRLALDWSLTSLLALSANAGYGTGNGVLFIPSLNLTVPGLGGAGVYVGYAGFELQGDPVHYLEGGVTVLRNAELQLDANAGFRIDDVDGYFVGVGLARRL